MPIKIIRNDITKVACDAIVNAANSTLLGGGGVDGAIHKAAGEKLLCECKQLGGCAVGQAKLTKAYQLPAKYVIHTVGPVWHGGQSGEMALLASCYNESLKLAAEKGCESIAFPLISSGAYGYPKEQALKVAIDAITSFLMEHEMLVYLVVFDKPAFQISEKLFLDIAAYIDDRYVDLRLIDEGTTRILQRDMIPVENAQDPEAARPTAPKTQYYRAKNLQDVISQIDESFSQMLLRKIDEKGMTDAACYKKANVDRRLFSKIRSDIHYHPNKTTAIAFAIALELNLEETKDLLMKAGFALSHSSKFDIIIEYFISCGNYDMFEINEALLAFDQSLLY